MVCALSSSSTDPTIYVITNLEMNHRASNVQPHRRLPIDERLLKGKGRYLFYITDEARSDRGYDTIHEAALDPLLHQAGKNHLGEWSFLLAEKKHAFCSYPLFMISSRFYAKNGWLSTDLNGEWERLFSYFDTYKYGFLPSYCRPLRWVKFSNLIDNPCVFLPFKEPFYALTRKLYGVDIPHEYTRFPDLGCHYLGFKDRAALMDYVAFYQPLLDYFFTEDFKLKKDPLEYVMLSGHYPNEKPLTFLFETLSHLYFYKKRENFFTLHYEGYYEVNFFRKKFKQLTKFYLPWFIKVKRGIKFRLWWLRTEGAAFIFKSQLINFIKWVKR